MSEPKIDLQIVDNVWVKYHFFPDIGGTHEGHAHTFDHITLLATGKVLMKHDRGEQEFTAPHLIVTPKGIVHQFITLEPNTVFCCIHAIRDGDGVNDTAPQEITKEEALSLLSKHSIVEGS